MPPGPLRVAILDDYLNVTPTLADWARLPRHVSVTFFTDHVRGDALVDRLQPFAIVVATRERTAFPRTVIERLPALRLLVTTGHRNAAIDLAACRERGIVVCGTDGVVSATVELTWALILAVARHIVAEDRALRGGAWGTALGVGLEGKTLGILGLGRIGSRVARIGAAFGMRTIAWSEHLTAERASAAGCLLVTRSELFEQADVLTLHLVLSERTLGIVGRGELAAMKPTALLVNTARAALVDQEALLDALARRAIAGAGLDVHPEEPLPPDAAIRQAPNTVLTPHLGYVTRETFDLYFPQALENIEAWLAGAPVRVLGV